MVLPLLTFTVYYIEGSRSKRDIAVPVVAIVHFWPLPEHQLRSASLHVECLQLRRLGLAVNVLGSGCQSHAGQHLKAFGLHKAEKYSTRAENCKIFLYALHLR